MLKSDFQYYLYTRSSKPRANGEVPVYLRIKSKIGRNDISTGICCKEENWSNDFKRINQSPESESSNKVLERWETKTKEAIDALCDEEEYFTVEDIRDYIYGKRKVTGLLEFYNIRREELTYDEDYAPNTLKVYKFTLNHLKEFLKKQYRRSDYPLNRLDYSLVSSFSIYLKSTCDCNTNFANKYLKTLKAVLNEARKQWLLEFSPFENYKIKAGKYNRAYLTEDELQKIIKAKLDDPKLLLVRDFFLFVCFTGLHYSDVQSLRTNHIITRNDQKWILKCRTKNGEETLLPLLKAAEEIVEKHKSLTRNGDELLKM